MERLESTGLAPGAPEGARSATGGAPGGAAAVEVVAKALRVAGVETQVGGHDLARIARASLVVTSPGIPSDSPVLLAARGRIEETDALNKTTVA
mgnify:CR=1 FL=1